MSWRAGLILALVTGVANAVPGHIHQGRGASTGHLPGFGVPGVRHNPALGAALLDKDDNFRSSILSLINVGVEAGPVDSFIDRLEDLEGCLEDVVEESCETEDGTVIRPVGDDSIGLDEAELLKQEFDGLLELAGRDAYFILGAQFQLPAFPMMFRGFGGVFGLDLHATGLARASVLDDPLRYNPITEDIQTRTAAYVKTARFYNLGVSWSRPVEIETERLIPGLYTRGDFFLGARVSLISASLAKVIAAVDSEDENGDTAFDRAEDDYEDLEETSTNVALDVGLQWVHKGISAGVTWRNINAPSFDYGPVGVNCDQLTTLGERQDCLVAASFADRVALRESFEMNPQLTVDAAVPLGVPDVQLAVSWDLNAANSPIGNEYQWLNIGVSYAPKSYLIPGVRVGYRSNLASGGISSMGIGLTLFGVMHLDFSQSSDSVTIDGDKIPRAAAASLSFELPL